MWLPDPRLIGGISAALLHTYAAVHISVEVWGHPQPAVQCPEVCLITAGVNTDSL
jgi:hypothetical protein